MSQMLPYFFLGLLLLAVTAWWIWDAFAHRGAAEVLAPPQRGPALGNVRAQRDLCERIFGQRDWDFVSRETSSEIRRTFQRERTVLAIAWLRRTRLQVSQVMRAHVAVARRSDDLQPVTELRIALSYSLFLILCNSLIGWIWLYSPVRARKVVGQTLQLAAQMRATFVQLMARIDPASCRVVGTKFNHGTVRS